MNNFLMPVAKNSSIIFLKNYRNELKHDHKMFLTEEISFSNKKNIIYFRNEVLRIKEYKTYKY